MKLPLIDLHPVTRNCQIFVSVGEAFDSKCSGILTLVVMNGNGVGRNIILSKKVNNLTGTMQTIFFEDTPRITGIFPVLATLVLESGEAKSDQTEFIELCEP